MDHPDFDHGFGVPGPGERTLSLVDRSEEGLRNNRCLEPVSSVSSLKVVPFLVSRTVLLNPVSGTPFLN